MYAPTVFSNLAKNFSSLSAIDQVGALADSNAMAVAGQQPVANFLDLASSTPDEASVHVWSAVAGRLSGYTGFLKGDEERTKKFKQFARAKLTPMMNKLGWEKKAGEPDYLANFRSEMIGIMSGLEDPATLAEAQRRFLAMDTDPTAAPASLRFLILAIVARNADEATWNALRERAQKEKSSMVKDSLYALLATAKNKDLAKRALDLALTDEPGATTSASMIRTVAGEHTEMAFDFAMANLAAVNAKVDATSRSRYFPGLAAGANDLAIVDKLHAYAKDNLDPSSRGEMERVIGNIKTRLKIREERAPAVKAWVDAHVM
jgi:aminopeptidase N